MHHPGSYPVYASDKTHPRSLYAALTEAGGLLPSSYVPGIVLYRKRTTIAADVRQKDVALALANLDAANGLVPAAKEKVKEKSRWKPTSTRCPRKNWHPTKKAETPAIARGKCTDSRRRPRPPRKRSPMRRT